MRFNVAHSFDVEHKQGKTHQHYLSSLPDLPLYSIQVPAFLCSSKLVNLAHGKNMLVFPFGVKSALMYHLLKSRNVDGVLTSTPLRF
jgi:glycerophosphoryl diester phosphodiesterase